MSNYHVVSVNHIDTAFVMRKQAQEEMVEIFLERIIGVMERHPQIHVALEQVAHYRDLKERRPDLFEKVKALLQSGRLEFMGGMATTAETNFPNGESLVRNQGMGLRWLEKNMGVRPHAGWLIDTFGLNPQVPQIMKQFGFTHLHANRFGGNQCLDLFRAQGLDGSQIVVMGRDSASINLLPDTQAFVFCRNWADVDALFEQADALEGELPKLVTYYIENEEVFSEYYLQLVRERQEKSEKGEWIHSTYQDFCEELAKSGYEPPVITDDLNPEFTGTFALRTPLKVENRKAENLLLDAEIWESLLLPNRETQFEACWWDLFHAQFHDVFTGSHEDITYRDILNRFDRVQQKAALLQKEALRIQDDAMSLICCNSLPWARTEWVSFDTQGKEIAVYEGNERLPQFCENNQLYFQTKLAPGSLKQLQLKNETVCGQSAKTDKKSIANEFLCLTLNERFGLESLTDQAGNCYLKQAGDFLIAEEDRGGMQIEQCEGNMVYASSGSIVVEEAVSNQMGECITMRGTFPAMKWNKDNQLSWKATFTLRKGERLLRLRLTLDWHGDATRIRLQLPFAQDGRDCYHEVPFGVKRRGTYGKLPTAKGEWPVQRFAALENGQLGIALLNQGVAGVEQIGNQLVTTLIRAYGDGPDAWVKPTALSSQHGEQTYEFAILPYEGNYQSADVVYAAQRLNHPVTVYRGKSALVEKEQSFFALQGEGIVLSAIKKSWDDPDRIIVRLYETYGKKTTGTFTVRGMVSAVQSDLNETQLKPLQVENDKIEVSLNPYEISTICLKTKCDF